MAKGGFYAVKVGRKPGIYSSWAECEAQVKGFPNAKYKKFPTNALAKEFINSFDSSLNKTLQFETNQNDLYAQKSMCTTTFAPGKRKLLNNANKAPTSQIPKMENDKDVHSKQISYAEISKIEVDAKFKVMLTEEEKSKMVHVYTDGACTSNGFSGAKAGIGVYWGPDHPLNTSMKLEGRQTNNRAEIHAAAYALNQAKAYGFKEITLHTDSQFLIKGITEWVKNWKENNWKLSNGKPVINKEDFLALEEASKGINVTWKYVPGHQGDPGNEAADKLAVLGASGTD